MRAAGARAGSSHSQECGEEQDPMTRAASVGPAAAIDETAQAVNRAHHALTQIPQRRTAAHPHAMEQCRAERLGRWHVDDQAAQAAEPHRELEGSAR